MIPNFSSSDNRLTANVSQNLDSALGNAQQNLYNSAGLGWADTDTLYRLTGNSNLFTSSHAALFHLSNGNSALTFDRYEKGADDSAPTLLRSKEESAPNHLFSSYWLNY
jgi:hypothetical protein